MAVTLQKIAEAAGVSRGTVDRALNNRGRIRPEVAERIRRIADEMGYQPNIAGRALAMAKRTAKIGVIVQTDETPFIQELLKGVECAKKEVESFGGRVSVKSFSGVSEKAALRAMDEFRKEEYSGLALIAMDIPEIKEKIRELTEEYEIPVVTFNADAPDSGRICFVGQNNRQSGRAAAGLMGEMLGQGGMVAVLSGGKNHTALNDRVKGFREEIEESWENLVLAEVRHTDDDIEKTYQAAEDLLESYPGLRGIYLTANGEEGLCRALKQYGKYGKIKVVAHDFGGKKEDYLMDGGFQFLLGQNAYVQGYQPVMILFRRLVNGEQPEQEYQYTDIDIKTRYTLTRK